jgi:hypothetical protein
VAVLVSRGALLVAAVAVAGCEPEITSGSYYCGPELACPPDFRCDHLTASCVYPSLAEPFECAPESNDAEPDDDVGAALELGDVGCGVPSERLGCVDNAGDVDYLTLVAPAGCARRPLQLRLRFPVAFSPLGIEVVDAAGGAVATGAVCTDVDGFGMTHVCGEATIDPGATYVVRVARAPGGTTCDGLCPYNRYNLSIF